MAINPNDGRYKAEQISASIMAMRAPLCAAYGVGPGNFGAKGNLSHDHGYHRSLNWVLHSPDSRDGAGDYSATLAADKGNPDDVAAVDFTPGEWGTPDNRRKMIAITARMLDALKRNDPRVSAVREFAGTLDGVRVVTYDHARQAFKTPFDTSHLDHGHTSIYRTMTRVDHSGIVSVMLGESMAEFTDRQLADLLYTLGLSGQPNGPGPIHARLNVLESNVAKIMSALDVLTARPAGQIDLTADQVAEVAGAARDGAAGALNGARIVVDPQA